MKGFIPKAALGLSLCVGSTMLVGCQCYRDWVDPCWPERYDSMCRHSVRDMAYAQTEKGHMLDQTVWNWMFQADPKTGAATAVLNGAGIEQLKVMSRRLPAPDFQIFLQTAQDVPYADGVAPEKLVAQRNELNERRSQAIQRFLATQGVMGAGAYHVAVHDFAPPGIPAVPIAGSKTPPLPIDGAYPKLENNFQGKPPAVQGFGSGPAPTAQ